MTADTRAQDRTGEDTTPIIQVNPQTCKGLCGWPIRDQFYSRPTDYV